VKGCPSETDLHFRSGINLGQLVMLSFKKLSLFFFLASFVFFFFFFKAAPVAYGGSQVRGPIGAVVSNLCQNHSNARSEVHLQLTAMPDP